MFTAPRFLAIFAAFCLLSSRGYAEWNNLTVGIGGQPKFVIGPRGTATAFWVDTSISKIKSARILGPRYEEWKPLQFPSGQNTSFATLGIGLGGTNRALSLFQGLNIPDPSNFTKPTSLKLPRTETKWDKESLISDANQTFIFRQFAVSPSNLPPVGRAVALFEKNGVIYASQLIGNDWKPLEKISNENRTSRTPVLGVDGNGNFMAVWVTNDKNIQFTRLLVGDTNWRPIQSLYKTTDNVSLENPSLDVARNGNAVLIWVQAKAKSGNGTVLGKRFINVFNAWETNPVLFKEHKKFVFSTSVGVDRVGNAVVFWSAQDSPLTQRRVFTADLLITANQPVNLKNFLTAPTSEAQINVAVNSIGQAVAVWSVRDPNQPLPAISKSLSIVTKNRPIGASEWKQQERIDRELGLDHAADTSFPIGLSEFGTAILLWQKENAKLKSSIGTNIF